MKNENSSKPLNFEKSHKWQECRAHLRISFWHLLMNFEKTEKLEFWKNEKKKKKMLEISSFYTHAPKATIIWSSWDTELDRFFWSFWTTFCLYCQPPNNPENQNFEKMKKASGEVITLNLYNKKHHTVYAYSDMECDRPLFTLLPHYWPRKLKFGKNVKKTPGDTIILHMCTINQDHMTYGSWDIKCKEQSFLSFWAIFALWPSKQPKKSKFWKNKKNTSFYTCIQQMMIIWCIVLEISSTTHNAQQTEFFVILGYFLQFPRGIITLN